MTQPEQDTLNEFRIRTACMLIMSIIAVGCALYWLRAVLVPFVLAIFFTYSLIPVIALQMRHFQIPRSVAIIQTVAIGIILLFCIYTMIYASVNQLTNNIQDYEEHTKDLIILAIDKLPFTPPENVDFDKKGWSKQLLSDLFNDQADLLTNFLSSSFGGIMGVVSNAMLVFIFMIFMIMGADFSLQESKGLLGEIQRNVTQYILTMFSVSAMTGFLVGLILYILGVDFALMFGMMAFLFNFIPNIGSIIATLLPVPIILLSPELSTTYKVMAILFPSLIQFFIGSILQPKLMGKSLGLHPVAVLISLMFFGMIWGIVGMFLATPIASVIKIIFERIDYTKPIADLLAGRLDALASGNNGSS